MLLGAANPSQLMEATLACYASPPRTGVSLSKCYRWYAVLVGGDEGV